MFIDATSPTRNLVNIVEYLDPAIVAGTTHDHQYCVGSEVNCRHRRPARLHQAAAASRFLISAVSSDGVWQWRKAERVSSVCIIWAIWPRTGI